MAESKNQPLTTNVDQMRELSDEEVSQAVGGTSGVGVEVTDVVYGYQIGRECPQCNYDIWGIGQSGLIDYDKFLHTFYRCEVCYNFNRHRGLHGLPYLPVPQLQIPLNTDGPKERFVISIQL